jgi:hypothetical protein
MEAADRKTASNLVRQSRYFAAAAAFDGSSAGFR